MLLFALGDAALDESSQVIDSNSYLSRCFGLGVLRFGDRFREDHVLLFAFALIKF